MQTDSTPELNDAIRVGLASRDRENMGPTIAYFLELRTQYPGNARVLSQPPSRRGTARAGR